MKKIILAIIPVLILAAAGGHFIYSKTTSEDADEISTTADDSMMGSDNKMQKVNGTFADLIKLGKNYSCTFDNTDDSGNKTKGIVYISSDKLNGEFALTMADGTKTLSNMIRVGNTSYIWDPSTAKGYKMEISEDGSMFASEGNSETNTGVNDNTDVNFDCGNWVVDNSVFEPPTDVEFTDLSAQMQKIQDSATNVKDLQCAACNSLPAGEARDACLSSLECN